MPYYSFSHVDYNDKIGLCWWPETINRSTKIIGALFAEKSYLIVKHHLKIHSGALEDDSVSDDIDIIWTVVTELINHAQPNC